MAPPAKYAKLVKLVDQYMAPPTPKVKVMSGDDQYICNDWANSHRYLDLSVDELEVGRNLETSLNVLL
jgi:hypothetical protein